MGRGTLRPAYASPDAPRCYPRHRALIAACFARTRMTTRTANDPITNVSPLTRDEPDWPIRAALPGHTWVRGLIGCSGPRGPAGPRPPHLRTSRPGDLLPLGGFYPASVGRSPG